MRLLSVGLAAFLLLTSFALGGPRSKEVGVLDYLKKYTDTPSAKACVAATATCLKAVKEIGLEPEWVDVDIFLPQNKAQRDQYKRIVIPTATEWFTLKMYEGMDDYVRSGGLLITNCSCILLDANENYKVDKDDTTTDFCRDNFLGVRGHASALMGQIKVLQECPLTKGLEANTWIKLGPEMAGRDTRNCSAEVVIVSDRIKKGAVAGEQPFLTYKHIKNGACIYLVGQIGDKMDKNVRQIITNALSPETLEWLCLQE
jgi:hypothetical protein